MAQRRQEALHGITDAGPSDPLPPGIVFRRVVPTRAGGELPAVGPAWVAHVPAVERPLDRVVGSVLDVTGDGVADVLARGRTIDGMRQWWVFVRDGVGGARAGASSRRGDHRVGRLRRRRSSRRRRRDDRLDHRAARRLVRDGDRARRWFYTCGCMAACAEGIGAATSRAYGAYMTCWRDAMVTLPACNRGARARRGLRARRGHPRDASPAILGRMDERAARRQRRAHALVSVVDARDPAGVALAEAQHDAQVPVDERAALVWRLSVEVWQLAHPDAPRSWNEPGLSRSTARIRER